MASFLLNFSVLKTKVEISPLFFAVLTAFLITDRMGIALWVVAFSLIHELSHFLILIICREAPAKVSLKTMGIQMELSDSMKKSVKIAVLSAGFLTNFILSMLFFLLKNSVFCTINLFLGIFTAFPAPSTDGGTVLKEIFSRHTAMLIARMTGTAAFLFLFILLIKFRNPCFLLPVFYLAIAALNY